MVMMPLRYCIVPRCRNRVPRGRCAEHAREASQSHRRYHSATSGQADAGVNYGRRWKRESQAFLVEPENIYCACGCGRLSEVVDHKVPHRGNAELFWDRENWQGLTKSCHDAKTAREVWHGRG